MQPYAWEGLKLALKTGTIRTEPAERMVGLMSTSGLEPAPIPLDTKVILVGEPILYYLLDAYEPDFQTLFKIQADFEYDLPRTPENQRLYADLIAAITRKHTLLPFTGDAVARVIEYAARLTEDAYKLSLNIAAVGNLLKEADYLVRRAGGTQVTRFHVQGAIDALERRASRIKDQSHGAILEAVRRIDTQGSRTGQINGLSVMELGGFRFGQPSRITAQIRPGRGEVVDIEREVEMGGPLHSKGVLILSAFLGARYAQKIPFGLRASLVFEQSYGGVEGDSASCAELCALISALSDTPLRQDLAMTGSVSQLGEVQAIGGINEKIEGFYDICVARGLTGTQGVILPASNIRHLMLRYDVVEAIGQKAFALYPIHHVDEGLELLTGITAGTPDTEGNFPKESLNGRVVTKLVTYFQSMKALENGDTGEDSGQ